MVTHHLRTPYVVILYQKIVQLYVANRATKVSFYTSYTYRWSKAIRTHHPRPKKWKIRSHYFLQKSSDVYAYVIRHPRQIIPTGILILIEIIHQITEYVCKNLHLYNFCLLQYSGAKITTKPWVSDAVELDIDLVSVTLIWCYVLLFWSD